MKNEMEEKVIGGTDRTIVVPAFVGRVRYTVDCYSATNKSQFLMGSIALVVATSRVEEAHILFMVVSHPTFGPDLVARPIAWKYNHFDTFNHSMLNAHTSNFPTEFVYEEYTLETWRRASLFLFKPVSNIMSYKSFLIMADDGELILQCTEPPAQLDTYPIKGQHNDRNGALAKSEKVCRICLPNLFAEVMSRTYRCVREESLPNHSASCRTRLLPISVSQERRTFIFLQRTETDKVS